MLGVYSNECSKYSGLKGKVTEKTLLAILQPWDEYCSQIFLEIFAQQVSAKTR